MQIKLLVFSLLAAFNTSFFSKTGDVKFCISIERKLTLKIAHKAIYLSMAIPYAILDFVRPYLEKNNNIECF
jgi:hypothetical protein